MSIPLGVFVKLQPEAPSVEEIIENIKYTDRCLKQEMKGNEESAYGAEHLKNSLFRKEEKLCNGKYFFSNVCER
jgi:hypothetical protein